MLCEFILDFVREVFSKDTDLILKPKDQFKDLGYSTLLNLYLKTIKAMIKFHVYSHFLYRSLVSASQDGKLIVWDSYTTNKVKLIFS